MQGCHCALSAPVACNAQSHKLGKNKRQAQLVAARKNDIMQLEMKCWVILWKFGAIVSNPVARDTVQASSLQVRICSIQEQNNQQHTTVQHDLITTDTALNHAY